MLSKLTQNFTKLFKFWRSFPTKADFETAAAKHRKAAASLEAARVLTDNQEDLIKGAVQAISSKRSDIKGFGNAYTSRTLAESVRDIEYYLRMITYSLIVDDTDFTKDENLTQDVKEIKDTSQLSPNSYIEALEHIKSHHGLTGEAAREANSYFDYAINALKQQDIEENKVQPG